MCSWSIRYYCNGTPYFYLYRNKIREHPAVTKNGAETRADEEKDIHPEKDMV
jgi:hypothetical protein